MDNLQKEIKNYLLQIIAQQNINLCCNGNNCDTCPHEGDNCVEERLAEAIINSGLFGSPVFNSSTALLLNASQPRVRGPQSILYHASSNPLNFYANGQINITPCKVGDTLYTPFHIRGDYLRKKDAPYPVKVVFIGLNDHQESGGGFVNVTTEKGSMWSFNFSDFNKMVFYTPEEALVSMKKEDKNDQ